MALEEQKLRIIDIARDGYYGDWIEEQQTKQANLVREWFPPRDTWMTMHFYWTEDTCLYSAVRMHNKRRPLYWRFRSWIRGISSMPKCITSIGPRRFTETS